jgi:hypothetical protein
MSQILMLASVISWRAAPTGFCSSCKRLARQRAILQSYGEPPSEEQLRYSLVTGGQTRAEASMVDHHFRTVQQRQLRGVFPARPPRYLCERCAITTCAAFRSLTSSESPGLMTVHARRASFTTLVIGCETGPDGNLDHFLMHGVGSHPRPDLLLANIIEAYQASAA